jgi:hypothetical protein
MYGIAVERLVSLPAAGGLFCPTPTLPQAILLLKSILPQPKFDVNTTIEIVNYYQRRHEAAYQSHRKRHLASLEK